jgi:AbrB family looped-hinge helix DNA binding protein
MEITKVSSKGQVVIPKQVRDAHGWREGTELIVENTSRGVLLRPKRVFKRTTVKEVIGCANYKGPARSIEEMDAAIVAEAVRRYKRAVSK